MQSSTDPCSTSSVLQHSIICGVAGHIALCQASSLGVSLPHAQAGWWKNNQVLVLFPALFLKLFGCENHANHPPVLPKHTLWFRQHWLCDVIKQLLKYHLSQDLSSNSKEGSTPTVATDGLCMFVSINSDNIGVSSLLWDVHIRPWWGIAVEFLYRGTLPALAALQAFWQYQGTSFFFWANRELIEHQGRVGAGWDCE